MKIKLFATLLMQFSALLLISQNSVKGVVVSTNNKGKITSVPFANVYWKSTNIGTSTDSNGVFQLAISNESNQLIASFVGYQSDTIIINDYSKLITINLKPSLQLETVTISSRKTSTEMSFINPMKMEKISERELFKAACCNLSESFETNASVDVNFTDAITGSKQIRMLGLDGPYTLVSRENMPGIRGLGNAFGLGFIPGSWISSIQVTKGVGSVVNGYESIAGQINTELKKPEEGNQVFFNLFGNQSGRTEANLVATQQINENWGTSLLLHGNKRPFPMDQNKDGFLDFPLQDQFNFMNRWKYNNGKGVVGQIGFTAMIDEKNGGQSDDKIKEEEKLSSSFVPYKLKIRTEKQELFGKMGYVFSGTKYKSVGLQFSGLNHLQQSYYGRRNYAARQQSIYANLIYQSIIGNTFHQFKTGAGFLYDGYQETFETNNYNRVERVPGVFFEYSYEPSNNFTLVAGIRGDYHNLFGAFVTPRIHLRWAANETTVFRALAGSGQRTANVFAERQSLMASSRIITLFGQNVKLPYGLNAERAWNFGFNVTKNFTLDYRDGYIGLDLYRTEFIQQVIVDLDQSPQRALIYNLSGPSYSNSLQVELSYELLKFLDFKAAYRFIEVRSKFQSGVLQKPFTAKHRFFANWAYETRKNVKLANWTFDLTGQYTGQQRIPSTEGNSAEALRASSSPAFLLWNTQVTRNFNVRWAAYVGVENLFNYRQNNPILDVNKPFGTQFDASMVWGPIFGRMAYFGLRYHLQKKE